MWQRRPVINPIVQIPDISVGRRNGIPPICDSINTKLISRFVNYFRIRCDQLNFRIFLDMSHDLRNPIRNRYIITRCNNKPLSPNKTPYRVYMLTKTLIYLILASYDLMWTDILSDILLNNGKSCIRRGVI